MTPFLYKIWAHKLFFSNHKLHLILKRRKLEIVLKNIFCGQILLKSPDPPKNGVIVKIVIKWFYI